MYSDRQYKHLEIRKNLKQKLTCHRVVFNFMRNQFLGHIQTTP